MQEEALNRMKAFRPPTLQKAYRALLSFKQIDIVQVWGALFQSDRHCAGMGWCDAVQHATPPIGFLPHSPRNDRLARRKACMFVTLVLQPDVDLPSTISDLGGKRIYLKYSLPQVRENGLTQPSVRDEFVEQPLTPTLAVNLSRQP